MKTTNDVLEKMCYIFFDGFYLKDSRKHFPSLNC